MSFQTSNAVPLPSFEFLRYWSARTWPTAEAARVNIKQRVEEDNVRYPMFGITDVAIVDHIRFSRAKGGHVKVVVSRSSEKSKAPLPLGLNAPDDSAPEVNWAADDNADDGTPKSIMAQYGRGKGRIYMAWVDVDHLPVAKGDDIKDGVLMESSCARMDLSVHHTRNHPPAIKVRVGPRGKVELMDGNYRLSFWREAGYDQVPCWVIDERNPVAETTCADTNLH